MGKTILSRFLKVVSWLGFVIKPINILCWLSILELPFKLQFTFTIIHLPNTFIQVKKNKPFTNITKRGFFLFFLSQLIIFTMRLSTLPLPFIMDNTSAIIKCSVSIFKSIFPLAFIVSTINHCFTNTKKDT